MIITALILVLMFFGAIWQIRPVHGNPFDKDNMHSIKGLAAIVVVMVHILPEYQNTLQDMIGSFAYIAVTIFFFASAYGMEFSLERKSDYLNTFWRNRLSALLVPLVLVNCLICYYKFKADESYPLSGLVSIDHYVRVLLEYCLIFYLANLAGRYFKWRQSVVNLILIGLIVISSLWSYYDMVTAGGGGDWPYERLGLVWGLLAYRFRINIERFLSSKFLLKFVVSLVFSVIFALGYLKYKDVTFWGEYLVKIVLGFAMISTLFTLCSRVQIANPLTKFLGNVSYPVYLSHPSIMRLTAIYFPALSSGEFIGTIYLCTFAFSFIVLLLSRRIIATLRK